MSRMVVIKVINLSAILFAPVVLTMGSNLKLLTKSGQQLETADHGRRCPCRTARSYYYIRKSYTAYGGSV